MGAVPVSVNLGLSPIIIKVIVINDLSRASKEVRKEFGRKFQGNIGSARYNDAILPDWHG